MSRPSIHTGLFNKAVRTGFLPLIAADGWRKLTGKRFGRLENDVYEWLAIVHDDRGTPRIMVEYGVMPLVIPSESENMNVGGRFWKGSHEWRGIHGEGAIEKAVEAMCTEWSGRVRPWMTELLTAVGFANAVAAKEHPNKCYDAFDLACVYMNEGQIAQSREWLERARTEFASTYRTNPHAEWADEHARLCQRALQEIAAGHSPGLCAEWIQSTYMSLELGEHFDPLDKKGT